MRSFFKIFFAALLALFVFFLILFLAGVSLASAFSRDDKKGVAEKSVLVLDLAQAFPEQTDTDPMNELFNPGESDKPGLHDVVRLIRHAGDDKNIAGIYLKTDGNANGFASSDEIRNALLEFKQSKKFVLAYGDYITQRAYFIASVADSIFVNPVGAVEWDGFASQLFFVKGLLDKLEIQPQIFYAGKFKSATEPFRVKQMTPENRLQTNAWLGDIYQYFLERCGQARSIDTATLHGLANTAAIQTPEDAVAHKLIDAVKYDDEVKDVIKKKLGLGKYDKMNLVSLNTYSSETDITASGKDRIAVLYAEGNIVDGGGGSGSIGGDAYQKLIRKLRLDKSIKAIVLRVNSGGGSALASEKIWRELEKAQQDKPVVVSFGDVAASGGYYIACGADSIFASRNTITGSIGVFGMIPNMQAFFDKKLGVTFDVVKTAPYADASTITRPLTQQEGQMIQASINRIYAQFLNRVAQGRKKDTAYVDSIAQGRVWSGEDAVQLGLVDKIGGLDAAIASAARLAKTDSYRVREYPQPENFLNRLWSKSTPSPQALIEKELGAEQFKVYQQLLKIKELCNVPQARLPFDFVIE